MLVANLSDAKLHKINELRKKEVNGIVKISLHGIKYNRMKMKNAPLLFTSCEAFKVCLT